MAGENTIFSLATRRKRNQFAPKNLRQGDEGDYYVAPDAKSDNSGVNNLAGDNGFDYTQAEGTLPNDDGIMLNNPNFDATQVYGDGNWGDTTPAPAPTYSWQGSKDADKMQSDMRVANDKKSAENQSGVDVPMRPIYKGATLNGNQLTADKEYIITDKDGGQHLMTFKGVDDKGQAQFVDENGNPYSQDSSAPVNENDENYLKTVSNADFLKAQGLDTSAQMQKDYDEYMKNAPEYVSEEEQARRLRSSQSAKTVADLGSLASAFANLYTTNSGGYNQQVAYAKAPDYNAYINQWTKQRDAYKTYAQKGRDYVYQKQLKDAQIKYNNDLQKLNLEYKQAQIDFEKAKSNSQLVNDAYKQQQLELAQQKMENDYAYKLANLNEKYRMDNAKLSNDAAKLGMEERRTSATEYNAYNKNSGNAYGVKEGQELYVGGNFNYSIPKGTDKSRMEKDIVQAMVDKGELDPNNYKTDPVTGKYYLDADGKKMVDAEKPRKTEAELLAEAKQSDKWSITAGDVVRRYGGEKIKDVANTSKPTVYRAKDGTVYSTNKQAVDHDKKNSGSTSASGAKANATTPTKSATKTETKSNVKVGDNVNGVKVAKVVNGKNYDDKGREIISY